MLCVAAVNRLWLTPALAASAAGPPQLEVLRKLARNSIIEAALGLAILVLVAILGMLPPAIHHAHMELP